MEADKEPDVANAATTTTKVKQEEPVRASSKSMTFKKSILTLNVHSSTIRTNQCLLSPSPHICYRPDVLPAAQPTA